jgi:hypothetical protein
LYRLPLSRPDHSSANPISPFHGHAFVDTRLKGGTYTGLFCLVVIACSLVDFDKGQNAY